MEPPESKPRMALLDRVNSNLAVSQSPAASEEWQFVVGREEPPLLAATTEE
jgi:hypothetical protein